MARTTRKTKQQPEQLELPLVGAIGRTKLRVAQIQKPLPGRDGTYSDNVAGMYARHTGLTLDQARKVLAA